MANFSQDPAVVLAANRARGYVGVQIEQGVPVLDRDLNLMTELMAATVRSVLTNFIGNGVAAESDAFRIVNEGDVNDFRIGGPGVCLVNGWEVQIAESILYSEQEGVAPLTTPPTGNRQDIAYLDVWTSEVMGQVDPDLLNDADVGMQTSVRRLLNWRVRVAEGTAIPAPAADHLHYRLATMSRTAPALSNIGSVTDERQVRLNLAAIEQRLQRLEQLTIAPSFVAPGGQIDPPFQSVGQTVTLHGLNFNIGTPQVFFVWDTGETAASVSFFTANRIVITVPTGLPGPVQIRVTTSGGTATSVDTLTVL